jgi:hypothetical protein
LIWILGAKKRKILPFVAEEDMMKKLLLGGFMMVALAGVSVAEETRYQVVQGTAQSGEPGKGPSQIPVVIKVDTATGDTWRLLVSSGGYWWIPMKNGVIKSKASDEKPADATAPAAKAEGTAPAPKAEGAAPAHK